MSSMALAQTESRVEGGGSAAAVVAAAARTQEWLRGKAAEVEQRRSLTPEVVERLVDDGLFRITQPGLYGGLGLEPRTAWEATYEIARGCSSTAWILGLSSANVVMIGKFSAEAQRDVFLSGKPTIVSLLTGGVGQDLVAEPVEGGVLLSGRWRYASGIDVATWAGLLVPIPIDGEMVPHVVLVPADAFVVDQSSWNVLGMRGTGSKDIALTKAFVPAHRWMKWQVLQDGGRHPTCPYHGAITDAPLNPINAMSTLAPTLAILRRSLLDDADEIVREAARSGHVSLIDRAAMRTRIAVASRLALQTTQRLFAALGGSVLPSGTRIERLFRDVHAMSSHMLLQPDAIGEPYGRLLLDLPLPPTARI